MGRWDHGKEKHLSFRACMKLAQEATMSGLWINIGHDWFTPEEFRVLANKSVIKYSDGTQTSLEIEKVKIKDPRIIIPRMELKISEMITKKEDFAKKVKEYYGKP